MLEEKIYQDYIVALKAKDQKRSSFLSFIRAALKNVAIDLKKDKLEDSDVFAVLKKQKKQLEDTKESMLSSGRDDLIKNAEDEIEILQAYLPNLLNEQELTKIIDQVIADLNAQSVKDMGPVMKEILSRVGVRADSKIVSNFVRQKLSSQ
ncbi:MAG: GatB/YqeY domain-containing protein [Candidatus Omnitrophica bacterium]|nr:GatB/YqeY domain-containing protein [Candidatus Omnitrophota bacterium]